MEEYEVGNEAEAVPAARHFVQRVLRERVPEPVVDAAELVATELITNALLHGAQPVTLLVGPHRADAERADLEAEGTPARLVVRDASRTLPVRPTESVEGMTGRGLALVDALAANWGIEPTATGKAIWVELTEASVNVPEPSETEVDALLAGFEPWPEHPGPERFTVTLGDVPTDLLLAAKAHVDSIVRELTLSAYGADSGLTATLPPHLAQLVHDVVTEFAEARQAIKRQAIAAAERGQPRTTLTLTLPAQAADAGERYLAALEEADSYGRASRLLTLAAPPQQRAFRRWYVTSLVDGLRRAAAGQKHVVAPTFETYLLSEIEHLAELQAVSQRAARLQRITAALSAALDRTAVADEVLDEAVAELAATRGALLLPDRGRLRVGAQVANSAAELERLERVLSDDARQAESRTPATVAFRTGEAVWLESREERDERFPALAEIAPDMLALCAVPLRVAGHVAGVLVLSFPQSRMFTADERSFVTALAAVAAQALERADLYDATTATARRLLHLQTLTAALATAQGVDGVLDVVIEHGRELLGASAVSVWLLADDDRTVRLARAVPPLPGDPGRWSGFDLADPLGIAEVMRTGEVVSVASTEERDARWPASAALDHWVEDAVAIAPLVSDRGALGAVRLSFAGVSQRVQPPRELLRAFAAAATQAILRARATDRAAEANRRLALLATASARLSSTLDVDRILAALARIAVPELADWCVVHLLENGELRAVAFEHADADKAALARQIQQRWPQQLSDPAGVGHVVRTGLSSLTTPGAPSGPAAPRAFPELGDDPQFREMVERLGLHSVLTVPLSTGARAIGALTLVTAEPGRAYDEADVAFAEELGRRAAVAVENARLFEAASERGVASGFPTVRARANRAESSLDAALSAADVARFEVRLSDGAIVADERLEQLFGFLGETDATRLDAYLARVHPDDVGRVRAAMSAAADRGGAYGVEYRVVLPGGAVRWIEERGHVLLDDAGRPDRLAGVAYDATEVLDARRWMARLLETMSDAFFRLDRQWRFTYVNRHAERVLFRRREELLGRNLWEEFPDAVGTEFQRSYEHAMATGQQVTFEALWAGAWFEVHATPEGEGLSVFFRDVTARRSAEQAREAAHVRLALRAEATRGLVSTLDPKDVLDRVTRVLVPRMADWAVAGLSDDAGRIVGARGAHRDEALGRELDARLRTQPDLLLALPRVAQVAGRGVAELVPTLERGEATDDPAVTDLLERLGAVSAMVVPLQSGRATLGVLAVLNGADRPPFTSSDLATANDIASQAGMALQNARLYSVQRAAAEVLQRSLLTPLPHAEGLDLAARYRPAAREAQVGGDWYDAFLQPDGSTIVVIGDVIGHDIGAAAAMGQLRNLLRGTAYSRSGTPGRILSRVDAAIAGLPVDTLATALVARLDGAADGDPPDAGRALHWSNAGHLPALLVTADGEVKRLGSEDDLLLGLDPRSRRHDHTTVLGVGDTLLLFTDGLVERRGMSLTDGLDQLETVLGSLGRLPLELLCDAVLAELLPEEADDDVALVAVRPVPRTGGRPEG